MYIPRVWLRAFGKHPSGGGSVSVWGWGDDESAARREANGKLKRLLERLTRGEPFPERYAYGSTRPLREEILTTLDRGDGEADAVITRNGHGVQVLNTARLLFLDIDVRSPGLGDRILRLFGRKLPAESALARLREMLTKVGRGTFRIYQTAAGYRAIAVDREYDPTGSEAQQLMTATGTDPEFAQLCKSQKSFRARLTPKPWRCDVPRAPREFPRTTPEAQRKFEEWLRQYEATSMRFATCKYLETVGTGRPAMRMRELIELHDKATRATEPLMLA